LKTSTLEAALRELIREGETLAALVSGSDTDHVAVLALIEKRAAFIQRLPSLPREDPRVTESLLAALSETDEKALRRLEAWKNVLATELKELERSRAALAGYGRSRPKGGTFVDGKL
jgi:hypothetical protein